MSGITLEPAPSVITHEEIKSWNWKGLEQLRRVHATALESGRNLMATAEALETVVSEDHGMIGYPDGYRLVWAGVMEATVNCSRYGRIDEDAGEDADFVQDMRNHLIDTASRIYDIRESLIAPHRLRKLDQPAGALICMAAMALDAALNHGD